MKRMQILFRDQISFHETKQSSALQWRLSANTVAAAKTKTNSGKRNELNSLGPLDWHDVIHQYIHVHVLVSIWSDGRSIHAMMNIHITCCCIVWIHHHMNVKLNSTFERRAEHIKQSIIIIERGVSQHFHGQFHAWRIIVLASCSTSFATCHWRPKSSIWTMCYQSDSSTFFTVKSSLIGGRICCFGIEIIHC